MLVNIQIEKMSIRTIPTTRHKLAPALEHEQFPANKKNDINNQQQENVTVTCHWQQTKWRNTIVQQFDPPRFKRGIHGARIYSSDLCIPAWINAKKALSTKEQPSTKEGTELYRSYNETLDLLFVNKKWLRVAYYGTFFSLTPFFFVKELFIHLIELFVYEQPGKRFLWSDKTT